MADLGDFNAADVPDMDTFEPIPNGIYRVMIIESEVKKTKKGDGSYLALKMELTGNEKYDNKKLFTNLNLDNPNEEAVQIATKELGAICRAVGVLKPGNSEKLHDIPFFVDVAVTKRNDTGEPTNTIRKYMSQEQMDEQKKDAPAPEGNKSDWMAK